MVTDKHPYGRMLRSPLLCLALLTTVALLFFWRVVFLGYTLVPADIQHEAELPFYQGAQMPVIYNHFLADDLHAAYPWTWFWSASLRQGDLPLWNPYEAGGYPLLANSTVASLEPFRLLLAALPLSAERLYSLVPVLQMIAAGVFMYFFLRAIRLGPFAAVSGGLVYMLNGSFVSAGHHAWSLGTFLWMPLVFLFLHKALVLPEPGYALVAGVIVGLAFLSGSVQMALAVATLLSAYVVVHWLMVREQRKRPLTSLCVLAVTLGVGVAVAAVQFLPSIELILADRGQRVMSGYASYSRSAQRVPPVLFLCTYLLPMLAGSTRALDLTKLGGTTLQNYLAYIGFLPLAFALMSLRAKQHEASRPFLATAVTMLVLILLTPLVYLLYHRSLVAFTFPAAVAAAMGLQEFLDRTIAASWARKVIRCFGLFLLLVAGALAIGGLVVALYRQPLLEWAQARIAALTADHYMAFVPDWWAQRVINALQHFSLASPTMWLPLLLAGVGLWGLRRYLNYRVPRRAFQALLLVVVTAELLFYAWEYVPVLDPRAYPPFPPTPSVAFLQQDKTLYRVLPVRGSTQEPPLFQNNSLMPYGIQTVTSYESLMPDGLHTLGISLASRGILDLQNVKYVLVGPTHNLPADHFRLVYDADIRIYENMYVMPRAFFISSFRVLSDREQTLAAVRAANFDPRTLVYLDKEPPFAAGGGQATADGVSITAYLPARVEIHVRNDEPGVLVLGDNWYPGWRATVDGCSTQIYRANWVLRAIALPPGEHSVVYCYDPLPFKLGGLISGSALALVGLTLVCQRSRLRRYRSVAGQRLPRVLVIGPTPPPYHGGSVFTRWLLDEMPRERLMPIHLETADRRGLSGIGRLDAVNVYLAIWHGLQCVWLLLTRRPRVVYLQLSQALLPFLRDCLFLVPSLALQRRVVVHLHGSAFRSVYETWPAWARFLARLCLRRVARVVVLCERLTSIFTGLVPEHRIVVIPNGVQPWVHSVAGAGPSRGAAGHVLYVGSLNVSKGVLDILRAMPQVIQQHPHVRFVFAGEWHDRESYNKVRQWIDESDLEGHIRFCGPVAGAAKEQLFREASMLLAPSYNEGQPFVVLEAMAAGLPVISTPVGCLADMVDDGVTGFLVAAGDCGQLADRICRLLADARMRWRMGQAGQAKCLSRFKSERAMAELGALLAEVAGTADDDSRGV